MNEEIKKLSKFLKSFIIKYGPITDNEVDEVLEAFYKQPEPTITETFIKQFLKDNLSININISEETDYGRGYRVIEIKLYLGGELLSESSDTIT